MYVMYYILYVLFFSNCSQTTFSTYWHYYYIIYTIWYLVAYFYIIYIIIARLDSSVHAPDSQPVMATNLNYYSQNFFLLLYSILTESSLTDTHPYTYSLSTSFRKLQLLFDEQSQCRWSRLFPYDPHSWHLWLMKWGRPWGHLAKRYESDSDHSFAKHIPFFRINLFCHNNDLCHNSTYWN